MINVLIVDDDAMVAELNRRYVAQPLSYPSVPRPDDPH